MAGTPLNKLDAYRIADPTFRVHARLFQIQGGIMEAAQANLKASRANSIGLAGATTSIFIAAIAMFPDKAGYIVPILILFLIILGWNIKDTCSKAKEFNKLIKEMGGEEVEKWVDYTTSVIAAYTTRVRMIDDAIEELEALKSDGKISDQKYSKDRKYCDEIRDYSIQKLRYFNNENETLHKAEKRGEEAYAEIRRYLEYYSELDQGKG